MNQQLSHSKCSHRPATSRSATIVWLVAGIFAFHAYGRAESDITEDWYAYDSNGNVILLTDEAAKPTARYQYDAFGKTTTAEGPAAEINSYRFSTKPDEHASGLSFYGYRYYLPDLGRWTAQDPLKSTTEINPYALLSNSPVGHVDLLGLLTIQAIREPEGWDVVFKVAVDHYAVQQQGELWQHVKWRFDRHKCMAPASDCDCQGAKDETVSDEMWEQLMVWDPGASVRSARDFSATARGAVRQCTWGSATVFGEMRYYEPQGNELSWVPPYQTGTNLPNSRINDPPPFWSRSADDGPSFRSVLVTWDWCGGGNQPEINISTAP